MRHRSSAWSRRPPCVRWPSRPRATRAWRTSPSWQAPQRRSRCPTARWTWSRQSPHHWWWARRYGWSVALGCSCRWGSRPTGMAANWMPSFRTPLPASQRGPVISRSVTASRWWTLTRCKTMARRTTSSAPTALSLVIARSLISSRRARRPFAGGSASTTAGSSASGRLLKRTRRDCLPDSQRMRPTRRRRRVGWARLLGKHQKTQRQDTGVRAHHARRRLSETRASLMDTSFGIMERLWRDRRRLDLHARVIFEQRRLLRHRHRWIARAHDRAICSAQFAPAGQVLAFIHDIPGQPHDVFWPGARRSENRQNVTERLAGLPNEIGRSEAPMFIPADLPTDADQATGRDHARRVAAGTRPPRRLKDAPIGCVGCV